MKKYIFVLCFLLVCSFSISAAEKMTIAVLDLNPKGFSKLEAKMTTDIIRSEFVNVANFTIVERSAMNEILEEQGLQMTGCTDQSCAVEIGKLLSARKIIVGEISKLGNSVILTLRIIDIEKGISEYSAREKADSIDVIDEAAVRIARNLTQRIVSGEKEFFTPQTKLGYYSRGLVPGWGQLYADRPVKAGVSAGLFLFAGIMTFYNYSKYIDARNEYDNEPPGSTDFNTKRDNYKTTARIYDFTLIFLGLTYVYNIVDIIFFSKPEFGVVSTAENKQDRIYYSFNISKNNSGNKEINFFTGIRF